MPKRASTSGRSTAAYSSVSMPLAMMCIFAGSTSNRRWTSAPVLVETAITASAISKAVRSIQFDRS